MSNVFLSQPWNLEPWRCMWDSDSLISDKLHCGLVTARMCGHHGLPHISPRIKGAHSALGSSDFPPEQSLLFCHMSHLRPGHPFSGQRPQRAQKARPGTLHFFWQLQPGLQAHSSRDRAQPAGGPISLAHRSLCLPPGRAAGRAGPRGGRGLQECCSRKGHSETGAASRLKFNSTARNLHCPPSESYSSTHCHPSKLVKECVFFSYGVWFFCDN